jgi:periplasmic protein TonB
MAKHAVQYHRRALTVEGGPRLSLVARADDNAVLGEAPSLSGFTRSRLLLSVSSEFCGIGRAGWLGAMIFYVLLAAAGAAIAWTATPPEPWPASQAVFKVVFEDPGPAPPEAPPATTPATTEAAAFSTPRAEPEPMPATVETAAPPLPVVEPEPAVAPRPKPPPSKPMPRRVAARPPEPAAPLSSSAAGQEQHVALLSPSPAAPVIPPRPITGNAGNVKPDYPFEARRRGAQGRVVLRVDVSAVGAPLRVFVLASSGHPLLDQSALSAVEHWRFNPATQAGLPVPGTVDVPVQFRLED